MLPKTWKEIVQVRTYTWGVTAPPPVRSCTHFLMTPLSLHELRTYLIDGPFLNQKSYKDIQTLYSLKYKHSKK